MSHTFKPLARLIALSGRRTRSTLRIFTTEIAEDLKTNGQKQRVKKRLYL